MPTCMVTHAHVTCPSEEIIYYYLALYNGLLVSLPPGLLNKSSRNSSTTIIPHARLNPATRLKMDPPSGCSPQARAAQRPVLVRMTNVRCLVVFAHQLWPPSSCKDGCDEPHSTQSRPQLLKRNG
ncbi:hypothetical protein ACRALDRAFT_212533 [Sodiomyces alcalophilus JCM 7366]|uniref:uncharacterized protein n=1 Tax=Sodiomyces alcalophilus JCM 7366 TaxID=591952 RepID=UPI0039B63104